MFYNGQTLFTNKWSKVGKYPSPNRVTRFIKYSQYAHIASKLYGLRIGKQLDNNGQSAFRQIFRKKSSTGQILDLSMFLLFITGLLFFILVCPYAYHLTLTTRKKCQVLYQGSHNKKVGSLDES